MVYPKFILFYNTLFVKMPITFMKKYKKNKQNKQGFNALCWDEICWGDGQVF